MKSKLKITAEIANKQQAILIVNDRIIDIDNQVNSLLRQRIEWQKEKIRIMEVD